MDIIEKPCPFCQAPIRIKPAERQVYKFTGSKDCKRRVTSGRNEVLLLAGNACTCGASANRIRAAWKGQQRPSVAREKERILALGITRI
jgi:hypothetical protein